MPEMWALNPETEGVTCEVDDPIARALCRDPELRGMNPHDLAARLGTSVMAAQAAILRLASQASGVRVVLRGVSFDQAIAEGGRAMGRHPIAYAKTDAGSLDSIAGQVALSPLGMFAFGLMLGFGLSWLVQTRGQYED